ncbi:MAG: O-antigen ligase family protein [Gordonia polyisoprenivorans]|nr:O-antigen ligase family protein [Gordonia polyisoprenivorans]
MATRWSPLNVSLWYVTVCGCVIAIYQRSGGNTTTLIRSASALFAIAAVMYAAYAVTTWQRRATLERWLVGTGLTYFAVQVIGYLSNDLDEVHLYNTQVMFLVAIPTMLIVIAKDRRPRDELLALAHNVAAAVVYASVFLAFALPSLAYGHRVGDERRWEVLGLNWRLSGVTPHQNLLAVTAIIAILLALHRRGPFWILTVVVSVLAIGLAEARNAAITAIAVLVVYWLMSGRFSPIRLALSALALALLYVFGAPLLDGQGVSDLSAGADNLNNRSEIWDAVLNAWVGTPTDPSTWNHFWLGYGPTSFVVGSLSPFSTLGYYNAHNQFMEAIAEGGVAGLLLIVAFLGVTAAIALHNRAEPLYVCLFLTMLSGALTEVFFTVHQYGVSFAAVPAYLALIVFAAGTRPRFAVEPTDDAASPTVAEIVRR